MDSQVYKFIDINQIQRNENQPRTHFEKESVAELAMSIQQNGLLQPIVVRPFDNSYQIVVGERRYRACVLAGLKEVPCIVQDFDESTRQTVALVENIQRENLSPIEEALAYQQILDTDHITQSELAQRVGKKQATVANKLRLLQLPLSVQDALRKKEISERHGRALLKLDNEQAQRKMLKKIVSQGLTVSQTEKKIETIMTPKPAKPRSKAITQQLSIALNTLEQALKMISQAGIKPSVEKRDDEDEVVYVIKFRK